MRGVPLDVRWSLLRQHGGFPQAYSAAVQPGLAHFGDEQGFIAYKTVWGTAMALADPVAPRERHGELIGRFLREHPDAAFWQVSRAVAEILAPLGFFINEMGPDPRLDLATYSFSGRNKQNLRSAINRLAKHGYVARECSFAALDADEVKAVSDTWRSTRNIRNREVAFLNRPIVLADETDVRKIFMFDRDGKLMAFGGFDPIYEDGRVVGYIAQHNRQLPQADSLADHAIKHCAIEIFQSEGKRWLFLGLAPFAYIEDKDFLPNKNWLVRRGFRFAYTNPLFNRFIYPLQGHEAHKRQFRGEPVQTYYAFNRLPSVTRLFKVLRACNIL